MKIGEWETHPAADLFPLLEGAEFEALCRSVRERGLEFPILLFYDQDKEDDGCDLVLDGRNRLRACIAEDVDPRFELWDGSDPFEYVWAHNAVRRHLEAGQRAALRLKFDEAQLAELAGRRQLKANEARRAAAKEQARGEGGTFDGSLTRVSATGGEGQTRKELAKRADVGVVTAQKAITVQKKAPELFNKVAAGEVSLSAAHRQVQRNEAIEQLRKEPQPLPDGKYRVISADPPWPYEVRTDDPSHRGAVPYHTMSIEQISALPVGSHAQDDSVLWLWTTNAFMEEAHQVARAWGFKVKTILTWDKGSIGPGNWLRNQTEHALMCVRGKPVVNLEGEPTIIRAPRGEHSEKPEEFYRLVAKLCPGSKVELFARKPRDGWTVWGSEVDGIVRRDGVVPAPATDEDVGAAVAEVLESKAPEEPENLPRMDDDGWMGRPAGAVADTSRPASHVHQARPEPIAVVERRSRERRQADEEAARVFAKVPALKPGGRKKVKGGVFYRPMDGGPVCYRQDGPPTPGTYCEHGELDGWCKVAGCVYENAVEDEAGAAAVRKQIADDRAAAAEARKNSRVTVIRGRKPRRKAK